MLSPYKTPEQLSMSLEWVQIVISVVEFYLSELAQVGLIA